MSVVDLGSILKYSSNIEIGQRSSIIQAQSQSGKRVAQRRGPVLYTMEMTGLTFQVGSDRDIIMRTIIIALNYGANTIRFTLKNPTSGGASPTRLISTGTWGGSPLIDNTKHGSISAADQTGKSVYIDGCESNVLVYNYTGDYVQFRGSDKVYQISGNISTSSVNDNVADYGDGVHSENLWLGNGQTNTNGGTILELNTPLVAPPTDNSMVIVGEDVQFHMSIKEMPTVTYLPGDVVQYGDMKFEEIIAD